MLNWYFFVEMLSFSFYLKFSVLHVEEQKW
jgi:hypothetical protein